MRKILWLLGLGLWMAVSVSAQSNNNPSVEIFGGPSLLRNGATAPHYSLYGGWQAQASFNFSTHVGIVG